MEDYFQDDIYNSPSHKKALPLEEYPTAKRLEMLMSVHKSIEYCCKNELNCGPVNATDEARPSENSEGQR